jgi:transposase
VIAIGRKNYLLPAPNEGAENWAMLASLIETCKLHDVNPEAYLTDVLTKLVNNWPNSRIAELTPWRWPTEH